MIERNISQKFNNKSCNFIGSSFTVLRNIPLDKRFVANTLSELVGGRDSIKGNLYDGIVGYTRMSDTFVTLNNEKLQPLILRSKIMNTDNMLSEIVVPSETTSRNNSMWKRTGKTEAFDKNKIQKYYKAWDDNYYLEVLNIEYLTDNFDDCFATGFENVNVFNKYMRGYDCIYDFDNNIYITKICERNDDIWYIRLDIQPIFNTDCNFLEKIKNTISNCKETVKTIDMIHDTLKTMSEIINNIKPETLSTDQSANINKITQSITAMKGNIDSLKSSTNISIDEFVAVPRVYNNPFIIPDDLSIIMMHTGGHL